MNSRYLSRTLGALLLFCIVFSLYIKTVNGKIILIPFVLCSIMNLGKSIALMLNQNRFALYFHRGFICSFMLYWFGFLIYTDYFCIRNKEYGFLLFSLIFWVAGILVFKRALIKKR